MRCNKILIELENKNKSFETIIDHLRLGNNNSVQNSFNISQKSKWYLKCMTSMYSVYIVMEHNMGNSLDNYKKFNSSDFSKLLNL